MNKRKINIPRELAAMEKMTPGELRRRYADLYDEPSRSGNRRWLLRRCAWRLQSLAEGGLSERAKRRARQLARDQDRRINETRKTPPQQGNAPGTNRKTHPKKQPGEHYTTTSYGHAIRQAVKKAYRPADMSNEEFKIWKAPEHWHPHQLRHNAATELRKEFGLEATSIVLGHRSATITEVYAERDEQQAISAVILTG